MSDAVRNRIKAHRRVRAGDLVPHEWNYRLHPDAQKGALQAIYREVGFARSLLAYELPDGRLKLIDGHLRRSMDPDMAVDVEVLDVSDAEARALLLAIDPLAQLAAYDATTLDTLRQAAEADSAAVKSLWEVLQDASAKTKRNLDESKAKELPPEQFFVLIECDGEEHQLELLRRFQAEGLKCQAKLA